MAKGVKVRSKGFPIVPIEEIKVRSDLSFEEEPIQIVAHDVMVMRRKQIPLVEVVMPQNLNAWLLISVNN
ncbi:serine/threonine-protein phosphatase 6 regulatory ankyrin repeat subunit C-like [Gossypium australe]|uniref:Serine/threonine-protein phosphatase 6 regulatory ankyrin repeat subunit C-like n=1 Tax=Gossypium australe TaxID=47621 RepID=A0A5B6VYL3_9ROSI|nr:serine/threonine-protein phosphatase 6 regulatory ankyrin repeat subunit C-like [Gossypium australe]